MAFSGWNGARCGGHSYLKKAGSHAHLLLGRLRSQHSPPPLSPDRLAQWHWPRSAEPPRRLRTATAAARAFAAAAPNVSPAADQTNSNATRSRSSASATTTSAPLTPFLLADIGEGIKEVELLQWYVAVGDAVQQFDRVCEVQSDKATVEITSRYDGVVASLTAGEVGCMVQVGQPLLHLRTAAASTTSAAAFSDNATAPALPSGKLHDTHATATTAATMSGEARLSIPTIASQYHLASDDDDDGNGDGSSSSSSSSTRTAASLHASPAVRKLGRDYGVDVATVRGTGPAGRVLKADLVTYLKEQGRWKGTQQEQQQQQQQQEQEPVESVTAISDMTPTTAALPHSVEARDEIIQLRGYSRLMVKSMTAALETPHMCFGDEVVVNELLATRRQLNAAAAAAASGSNASTPPPMNISLLALLVKAISCALSDHPVVNAVQHSVADCSIRQRCDHNIGIAMDTPRGLIVPVVRQCQIKSVADIQRALDRLKAVASAAGGSFGSDDLADATFTVSNIGSVGAGTYMQPVLAPPALAMGALGRIKVVPRFRDEADVMSVYAASVLTVTWAADHRFLDGARLGRFHRSFAGYVERPITMLARLK